MVITTLDDLKILINLIIVYDELGIMPQNNMAIEDNEIIINNLNEYILAVQDLINNKSQKFVFRGQSDDTWALSSSAARRIRKTLFKTDNDKYIIPNFLYISYIRDLISDFQLKRLDLKQEKYQYELDILAELQHFGAATCLVDFTLNSLISLFFACESHENKSNGAVFVININNRKRYSPLEFALLKNKMEFFLKQETRVDRGPSQFERDGGDDNGKLIRYNIADEIIRPNIWYWEAPHINHRIPIQQSIFLFGTPDLKYDKKIIINKDCKTTLLRELNSCFNISEETLFPDFSGFSRNHIVSKNFNFFNFSLYVWAASECSKTGESIEIDTLLKELQERDYHDFLCSIDDIRDLCIKYERRTELKKLCSAFIEKNPAVPELYIKMYEICLSLNEDRLVLIDWLEKGRDIAEIINDNLMKEECNWRIQKIEEEDNILD